MRVLFVGFVWPEPKSSAAGQNILSYINTCLAQNWQVYFCSSALQTEQSLNLEVLGVQAFQSVLNCESFDLQVEEIAPDVVIFDRYLSFEQFAWRARQACPRALLVLDAEDLHFLRHARSLWVKSQKGPLTFQAANTLLQKENQNTLYNDLLWRELTCILQADLTIILSEFEYALLKDNLGVPSHQLAHVPFILNKKTELSPTGNKAKPLALYEQKQDFVFIGNFRHAPNFHAVKVLRENLWPQIYKELKAKGIDAKCHVYGAYLSPKAKQLENKKLNFLVHGYTEDQFESITNARVMLAPITFGAGVKGKLIDAMRCKTPSITTVIGAEGITHENWPGAICDTPEQFIAQAIRLYSCQNDWQLGMSHCTPTIDSYFNSEVSSKSFVDKIEHAISTVTQSRQTSIMQTLLWQNQFLASKYMSQWIEAKNK